MYKVFAFPRYFFDKVHTHTAILKHFHKRNGLISEVFPKTLLKTLPRFFAVFFPHINLILNIYCSRNKRREKGQRKLKYLQCKS